MKHKSLRQQDAKRFKLAMARLDGQVEEIINARREAQSEAHSTEELPQDLLDFFLKSERVDSGVGSDNGEAEQEQPQQTAKVVLNRQVIVDNIKTFLFAGHDTTASAISWALYLVSTQ